MTKIKPFKIIFAWFFIFNLFSLVNQSELISHDKVNQSNEDSNKKSMSSANTITFSGYDWSVRTSNGQLQGPGPNYFSDSHENVWLDEEGYLHLKLSQKDGTWYCSEVYSLSSFGYGTYKFTLAPGFEDLDENVVVGLFTYLDDTHEIDIEFARWGQKSAQNGQFVVQPYSNIGNLHRFDFNEVAIDSCHSFEWCEQYIYFWSAITPQDSSTSGSLVSEWTYIGNDNPTPSNELVHINLWLMDGLAPNNSEEAEIIIKSFKFISSQCNRNPTTSLNPIIYLSLIVLAIIGISFFSILILWKLKKS